MNIWPANKKTSKMGDSISPMPTPSKATLIAQLLELLEVANVYNTDFANPQEGTIIIFQDEEDDKIKYKDSTGTIYSIGGQGGGGIIDVTFSALTTLIGSGLLVPGQFYKITDYATAHNIMRTSPPEQHRGSNEPLIVLATSTNTLHHQAISTLYPQDIIYYDITGGDTNDISFFNSNVPISELKGVIYYREDTVKNVSTYFDFRNVINRRWAINPDSWISPTVGKFSGQVAGMTTDVTIQSSNVGRIGNITLTANGTTILALIQAWNTANDHNRVVVQGPGDTSQIPSANIVLSGGGGEYAQYAIVKYTDSNVYQNIIIDNSSTPGVDSTWRKIVSMTNPYISTYLDSFNITNSIRIPVNNNDTQDYLTFVDYSNTNNFEVGPITVDNSSSILGNNVFFSGTNSKIGRECFYNTIGDYFNYNTIGDNFTKNTIVDNFQNNKVNSNTCNNINFSSSTLVYLSYNKEITNMYSLSSGTVTKLWYYDGDNSLTIFANITD